MKLSEEELKHAQEVLTSMMGKIHEVCEKNKIKYWVGYGSLIGAVRHNGFIPWDDDFDICMFREDYERFNIIAQKELGDEFFWQTYQTDRNWGAFQSKIRLKNTLWMERSMLKTNLLNYGIYIDVFPFDYAFENRIIQAIHFMLARFFVSLTLIKFKKSRKYLSLLLSIVPLRVLMWITKKIIDLPPECSLVTNYTYGRPGVNVREKQTLEEVMLHRFGKYDFYIPVEYDYHLQRIYGNYMELPPEKERKGHHNIIDFNFGEY